MIYREFTDWQEEFINRLKQLTQGVFGLLFYVILMGIVSLFVYCGKQIEAFFRRETIAASIVAIVFVLMSVGWTITFVKERHKRVEAQHKADSLSYDLSKFTQMYDSTELIVINGDTIRNR